MPSHADYLIEVFEQLAASKDSILGMRVVSEPPRMRHFTATFERL